jgi:hypothetical protein
MIVALASSTARPPLHGGSVAAAGRRLVSIVSTFRAAVRG